MASYQNVGSRIREKRLDRGLRQASVAQTVGISASYLNLIEHDKRRIGGKLLTDIARALAVDPTVLSQGADADVVDGMRSAAAQIDAEVELGHAEELARRYPRWSGLIVEQSRRIAALQNQLSAMSDRMASDPQLAGSLHDVISAVSAIRSTASILVGPEKLDDDWQRRFHANIHNDSLRLAVSSEALITYLEAPDTEVDHAAPIELVERYLAQTGFHLAALEQPHVDPAAFAAQSGLSPKASRVLAVIAAQYQRDAAQMPLDAFTDACQSQDYDPAALAEIFAAPLSAVLRRLAALPSGQGHPPFGLAICDAAGVFRLFKPVSGFSLPRAGGACPLWPLYAALSRPAQPIRLEVSLPGSSASRLLCYAIAETRTSARFDVPPPVESTMLVMPDPGQSAAVPVPVGTSCRICPRMQCTSRREPAMAGIHSETVL